MRILPHRFLALSFVILLAIIPECIARPEFYVRPLAQYTNLPSSSRKTDLKHSEVLIANPGDRISSRDYTVTEDSFNAGISIGIILGQERSLEIGVEAAKAKYSGRYLTPEYSGNYYSSSSSPPIPVYRAASTQTCSFSVQTVLASFRRNFGKKTDMVRPYVSVAVGTINYDVTETERPSGFRDTPINGTNDSAIWGLGGGVNIKLGKHADIEVSYRLLSTRGTLFNNDDFYGTAHVLSLGLGVRI